MYVLQGKNLMATAYNLKANGQVVMYKKTIVTRFHHYIAEQQRDLDLFVQPLTYAYNTERYTARQE